MFETRLSYRNPVQGGDSGVYMDQELLRLLISAHMPGAIRRFFRDWSNYALNEVRIASYLALDSNGKLPINFFDMPYEEGGLIFYTPADKLVDKDEEGNYRRSGRQSIKPGRWLKMVLSPKALELYEITDAVVEQFAKVIKAQCSKEVMFMRVRGADIAFYYHENSYVVPTTGTLAKSCMRYGTIPAARFDFYGKNPNCSMLVALSEDGKVMGRALVWQGVHISAFTQYGAPELDEDITFMDRIYSLDTWVDRKFMEYAQKEGWYRKTFQNATSMRSVTSPTGKPLAASMKMSLPFNKPMPHGSPYLDTFCYLPSTYDEASNTPLANSAFMSRDMGGTLTPYQPKGANVLTALHGWVHKDLVATCASCGYDGDVRYFAPVDSKEKLCDQCAPDRYVYVAYLNRWVARDQVVPGLDSYGGATLMGKDEAVYSRTHKCMVSKRGSVHLGLEDDYVVSELVPTVQSSYHNTRLRSEEAVLLPGVGNSPAMYVHKDSVQLVRDERVKQIKAQIAHKKDMAAAYMRGYWPHGYGDQVPHESKFKPGDLVQYLRGGVLNITYIRNVKLDRWRFGTGFGYSCDASNEWMDENWFQKLNERDVIAFVLGVGPEQVPQEYLSAESAPAMEPQLEQVVA